LGKSSQEPSLVHVYSIRKKDHEIRCLGPGLDFLDHQRAVLRAEPDAIAKRYPHLGLARGVGDIVEITIRIGIVEVDRRRNGTRFHCAQGRAQTGGAAGALGMADL
jgi:hypothetical protein